ncbi:hypothetical protein C9J21_18660 [Photobacterium phosphoreum]|uniref:hypothetical protein n=1 Tax=Photobacterium phosphoreum TaxID=659 RepID=UPI000D16B0B2|nr:hypothetical protein [Photobacterium phosphoreum]PSW30474.1 hypothetical protein C9J21_18660 [Photobacterium phosphoreum]
MGINEFFEKVLGQKLPNQYSWGCYVPTRKAMCWTVWKEEIKGNRVEVHSDIPYRTKAGHVNRNWTKRKEEFGLVQSGVPAYGVMISCGKSVDADSWNIQELNSHEIFELSDLEFNEKKKKWTMIIDINRPIAVEKIKFDQNKTESTLKQHTQAFKTYEKATKLGWELIGLNEQIASLSLSGKLMDIVLFDGSYIRK